MIDHGETPEGQIKAYKSAFPKCKTKGSAEAASWRLLKDVRVSGAIAEGRAAKQKIIDEALKEELRKKAIDELISQEEVDTILIGIMRGTIKNEVKKPVFNPQTGKFEVVTYYEEPSANEKTLAADKYYRRYGGYAAKKYQQVEKDTVLLPGEDPR